MLVAGPRLKSRRRMPTRILPVLLLGLCLTWSTAMAEPALAQSRQGPLINPRPAPVAQERPFDVVRTLAMAGGALAAVNLSLYALSHPTANVALRWLARRLYIVGAAYGGAMAIGWLHDVIAPDHGRAMDAVEEMHADRPALADLLS